MLTSRPLRGFDTIIINIYYTGLSTLSQTMTPLVVPLLVQQFVGEQRQASAYGAIRLWTLMTALLMQAMMGMLSDRSRLPWGRRRPFIMAGTLATVVVVIAIGLTSNLQGDVGYWTLFSLLILMMVTSNTAHGAQQGLIPDLVPENKRGLFSSIKAVLEVPIPFIFTSLTIGKLIAGGHFWPAIGVLIAVLLTTMLITMFAPEKQLEDKPAPLDFAPLARLALMTAAFTLIILGLGEAVRRLSSLFPAGAGSSLALWGMGLAGLAAMAAAVILGVLAGAGLALGEEARRNSSFVWWVINRLAFLVGATNIPSFAIYFLQGRLGLSKTSAAGAVANLFIVIGGLILITAPLSGRLCDRIGRKPVAAISGLVAAIGGVLLALSTNLTMVYVAGAFVGVATGAFYTANWALGTELVKPGQAGRYLGIANLAGAGAGAGGAYLGGPIADHFTRVAPQLPGLGYALIFGIYAALFLLSTLALTQVKKPQAVLVN